VILVDTSVWIDHWRRGNSRLAAALELGRVIAHPFVIGELACGTMPRRSSTLSLLEALPVVLTARHDEVMTLIERHRIAGTGLGWVDAHLLASAALSGTPLWTLDRPLRRAAERLDVFGEPEA
jgi:predicted nucleic acid-binding protein